MKKIIGAILLSTAFCFASDLEYTAYLESWDSAYVSAYQGLVTSSDSTIRNYEGVTLNLSFAAFVFAPPNDPPILYGTCFGGTYDGQNTLVDAITAFVCHTHGGKVQLAYGGNSYAAPYAPNYFISQTTNWPNNIPELATGVAGVITALDLDGVDFDIEDPQPSTSTPQEFAQQLTTFLQAVRTALPTKTITLTIPAQGWGLYWQYLAQNVAALPGTVNAINFMEYDIWINPAVAGYVEQVKADILTYTSPTTASPAPNWSPGWGIPPSLVQIGIMPGNDDNKQLITTTDAQALTQYAIDQKLPGVFIWDIGRDALTVQTPTPFYPSTPYAYSNAIRSKIALTATQRTSYATRKTGNRFVYFPTQYTKQANPPHGKP